MAFALRNFKFENHTRIKMVRVALNLKSARRAAPSIANFGFATLDADKRLAAGEAYELLIMSGPSIDEHPKDGKLMVGSRVDLANPV